MDLISTIRSAFNGWIDSVAATANSSLDRLRSTHTVRMIEASPGSFVLKSASAARSSSLSDHSVCIANGSIEGPLPRDWARLLRGSRIELILNADRFLFRPLELPKRAVEFLDGIVKAQIDRLTPWSPSDAVFSWTPPADAPGDRVALTIAATARALITPYVQAVTALGVSSVAVLTTSSGINQEPALIKVYDERARRLLELNRIRRALVLVFAISGLAAASALAYSAIAIDQLDSEQQALATKIAQRRSALRTGPEFAVSSQRMLERRKQTAPSSVVVLDALSDILPDHTYVTELRIEGDKLEVIGVTRDAPALIGLIERSPHFSHATFVAPTTRAPGDTSERFHIEAHINSVFRPYISVGT